MLWWLGFSSTAAAQATGAANVSPADIEIPTLVLDEVEGEITVDEELDLLNLVQTAAKSTTTVQEAPAIVTVITDDEIRDAGYRSLEQAIDAVPGWLRLGAIHNQFQFPLTRGVMQATMFMHNGVSLFDPTVNAPQFGRVQPLETIKRIELVTGPGGVLWGANSFLGIVNLITKDASDVDGVEAAVQTATGNGDRNSLRGYVMAGVPELFDDVDVFFHTSFDTYLGPAYQMPQFVLGQPLPQPNSTTLYGPLTTADPQQSFLFNLNGKVRLGPVNVSFSAPFVERHTPLGFPGFVVRKSRAEDTLEDAAGNPICPSSTPLADPTDSCLDKGRRARDNRLDWIDRYLVADYSTRYADERAGSSIKLYLTQFVRDFDHLGILAPSAAVEGGLAFRFDATSYRAGGIYDGDISLPAKLHLLYGAEAFHEWFTNDDSASRQGKGISAEFLAPYNLDLLPVPCPRRPDGIGGFEYVEGCPLTFASPASRTVMGGFINPQWRPSKRLTIDAGVRMQAAPESFGKLGYDLQTLLSGAMVIEPIRDWHIKLNYAEGFRPPVFNNTSANGEAVNIGGSEDIDVEKSQAIQAELNARVFKGKRRIRELAFRADYSYTRLEDLIQVVGGRYENSAPRGIHSVEFLGRLFVTGGHRIELGYTYLRADDEQKGRIRSLPEHWFNLSSVVDLGSALTATTRLRVLGAMEDPNRLVDVRHLAYDDLDRSVNAMTGAPELFSSDPNEVTFDRLPPSADLTLGLIYRGIDQFELSAFAHNAFNARYYQPDGFYDLAPRLEQLPNPAADFRFTLGAAYRY
jgi:outer membrane receptor protein involved in Fe transport